MEPPANGILNLALQDGPLRRMTGELNTLVWDELRRIADRLEDMALDRHAYAFRWLANEERFPTKINYYWTWTGLRNRKYRTSYQLPKPVMELMKTQRARIETYWNCFDSVFNAFWGAADAIAHSDIPPADGRWAVPTPKPQE